MLYDYLDPAHNFADDFWTIRLPVSGRVSEANQWHLRITPQHGKLLQVH